MYEVNGNRLARLRPILGIVTILCVLSFTALAGTKTASAPKPAAKPAARPAASAAKPGAPAGAHGATTPASHGPTTGGVTTHGPTTGGAHTTTTTGGAHTTTPAAGGHAGGPAAGGHTATGRPAPAGSHTAATPNGSATHRADGRVSDVHDSKRGMDVHHGLNGSRRVSAERPDHSRVVAERGRPGYVQRPYGFRGHDYGRRAYFYHGHAYNRFYRGYGYHGVFLDVYAPGFYFAPAFYGWAYNPWLAPVAFGWGWGAAPWYGFYGGYFAPAPVYATPAEWLTDYVISTNLQAAYAAQQEAHTEALQAAASGGQPMLTPDVKAQIAAEVRAQIALENAEAQQNTAQQEPDPASSSVNRMFLDGKPHVFVANAALDVVDAGGNECAISDGDVLHLAMPPAANSTDAQLTVLASKGGRECPRAVTVTVAVKDLQEMQNGLRESLDQGLQDMQSKAGTGGLPAAPPSTLAKPVPSLVAQAAPPPEANPANDINQQLTLADQAEKDAGLAVSPAPVVAGPPQTIAIGQSIDDVTGMLGQPVTIIDLGPKKIYKYADKKIIFKAGKVVDVDIQ